MAHLWGPKLVLNLTNKFSSHFLSQIGHTNVRISKNMFKDRPGCLFTRTFLLKSSYTLLQMLECLKLHASPL